MVNRHTAAQQTLKTPIRCRGTGLHSGEKIAMTIHPAAPDSGILFRRVDLDGAARDIPALWDQVTETTLCTTIGDPAGACVRTIEHLMAAFAGCGIDNAVIEIDGPEVPIMDGSSEPFVFLIECAGIAVQDAPRRAIEVLKPVEVRDGEKRAALSPGSHLSISFEIDYDNPAVAQQSFDFSHLNGAFKADVCRARTYGFREDVDRLREMGLALGGSLENAIVVDGDTILNEGGLRYSDEFVRHKVLDSLGDLYLAGAPILGRFDAVQSGHHLNNRLLHRLLADDSAWRFAPAPAPVAHHDLAAAPTEKVAAVA